MTEESIATDVRRIIAQVAPDVDPATIQPEDDIRRTLGIDSFDHLRILTAIGERFGFDIPESDHTRLRTVGGMAAYILGRTR
jgi:acyl carrier protein